jgi:hypothetical protein
LPMVQLPGPTPLIENLTPDLGVTFFVFIETIKLAAI